MVKKRRTKKTLVLFLEKQQVKFSRFRKNLVFCLAFTVREVATSSLPLASFTVLKVQKSFEFLPFTSENLPKPKQCTLLNVFCLGFSLQATLGVLPFVAHTLEKVKREAS